MLHTVISGDVIASTSLSDHGKARIENSLLGLIEELKKKFSVYSRVIKGDYIECYVPTPKDAMRVMLIIKGFMKSIALEPADIMNEESNKVKSFKTHRIRLALGIGELSRLELNKGIIDGEAIYLSGRVLDNEKTHDKKKVIIKNTLFLRSSDKDFEEDMAPLFALIDFIMSKNTAKQSQVIYHKLMNWSEDEIADELRIKQPTINQHSRNGGWNPISEAVQRFEKVIETKVL